MDQSRTLALIGEDNAKKLKNSTVALFGVGGVGSYAAEALCRAGVGNLILIDNDVVKPSNANRQLVALNSTIGMHKTVVMQKRILDINKDARVTTHQVFFDDDTKEILFATTPNYVVDAIDSVKSKLLLIKMCYTNNIPIISAMGAGNKLNPTEFEVTDIYKTTYDPLAKIVRKQLREWEIPRLKVVCSKEMPIKTSITDEGKQVPASISFVPSVCGLIMASEVIKDIISK